MERQLPNLIRIEPSGFNGAAFFQSGKYRNARIGLSLFNTASMEPLFFKAENIISVRLARLARRKLQWSRFFSKRKICDREARREAGSARFNGAAFFQSGKCEPAARQRRSDARFNGAAFFQSGKWLRWRSEARWKFPASMEPLFFKAENPNRNGVAVSPTIRFNGAAFFQSGKLGLSRKGLVAGFPLQWSRFFSKRKMRRIEPSVCAVWRFNGAAFFQSGKSRLETLA